MSCVLGDTRPVIVASVLFISARLECGGGLEAKRGQVYFAPNWLSGKSQWMRLLC